MKKLEAHTCHGGDLQVWEHTAKTVGCDMRFSVFLPKAAIAGEKCPAVIFLSGLTCTHENFTTKANAYQKAAELGLIVIAPDTSPRGDDVPDDEAYDFGKGAGFYINATEAPWATHYQMESYITDELHQLILQHFPIVADKISITGHSMGGHGALTLFFKYPGQYQSASAFAPIVAPAQVPWGHKAFTGYIGADQASWLKHDACALVANSHAKDRTILIDQGLGDNFLTEQLKPELFEKACAAAGQNLTLRLQEGYDHSYYFIQSFIDDHLEHHYQYLK